MIAVDPAALRPDVAADAGVRHVCATAFGYEPGEPVDFARVLIANFKLPMKRKAEMVARLCEVLEDAGFQALRCRQLYHDRDEVTVFART